MNADLKRRTIIYWERRRVLYNVVLVPVTISSYGLRTDISAGVGDARYLTLIQIALLFLGAAVAANACYSFVYALEFFAGTADDRSRWVRYGRSCTLVAGTILSAFVAMHVARDIGALEYTPSWLSSQPVEPAR